MQIDDVGRSRTTQGFQKEAIKSIAMLFQHNQFFLQQIRRKQELPPKGRGILNQFMDLFTVCYYMLLYDVDAPGLSLINTSNLAMNYSNYNYCVQ